MRLSRHGVVAAIALAVALSDRPAFADDAGAKALTAAETAMNKARSIYFEYEGITTETGKAEKKFALNVWIKGEKRLTEFTAPADMKGTKVLILAPDQMYVYLPAFGKVRRIASHTADQSSFGMAFSQDEFAPDNKYADDYTAGQDSTTDKEIKITLTPLSGKTTSYSKIQMTIAKDKNVPTELKYFNAEGKHVKTETRSGYTRDSDVWTPGTIKMVDHTKSLTTTLTRKKVKINESINDETFSKRNLEK